MQWIMPSHSVRFVVVCYLLLTVALFKAKEKQGSVLSLTLLGMLRGREKQSKFTGVCQSAYKQRLSVRRKDFYLLRYYYLNLFMCLQMSSLSCTQERSTHKKKH